MKVLVTGGSGFIGSHIAKGLSEKGCDVVILDNKEPKWKLSQKIQFVKGDIRDADLLNKIPRGIDCIFHEAALVSVIESMQKPKEAFDINLIGTLNVLRSALENNVEKVIFASSCAIYGDNPTLPKREDMPPEPKSPYAISKLCDEHLMKMFYEEYGLKTTSLRYFNVYGSRQKYDSPYSAVIPIFINNALKNKPLEIYGDGLQTRDFIFVDDIVQANELVMEKGDGEIFNVGSGKSISIKELAKIIIELTNSKSKIVYKEARKGEVKHSRADISKIERNGFSPDVTLEEGLKKNDRMDEEKMIYVSEAREI